MMIADNVKKGGVSPTPGSYSYTWIQFSVSNGQLQPKDDYEILPHPSFKSVKSTRTRFTEKDDAILVKWVLKREGSGEAGNLIYQDLARQVSRTPPPPTSASPATASMRIITDQRQ